MTFVFLFLDFINAINDIIKEIILTDSHVVISAMQGNAAAGGVILALASDKVYAREGIVLNPHYKKMGLYGSEYWTYLLPKRVGQEITHYLTDKCITLTTNKAKEIGIIDDAFSSNKFIENIKETAENIAMDKLFDEKLKIKRETRLKDESTKLLQAYRDEELKNMWSNFYDKDSSYDILRKNFVYKISCIKK